MNRRSILTKTGKGLMEATGKTSALSRDHRNILKEIDGKVSVSELMQKFAKMTEPELLEALRSMEEKATCASSSVSRRTRRGPRSRARRLHLPPRTAARTSTSPRLLPQSLPQRRMRTQDFSRRRRKSPARPRPCARAKKPRRRRGRRRRRGQERRLSTKQGSRRGPGFRRRPTPGPTTPRRRRKRTRSTRRGARPKSGSAGKPKRRRAAK